ncbi:MAG: molybdopterin molybdotransferase MoeA [Firmicutes bacterium]|nr:molybdopterin molybdotransferase MoeA [Bacillota bacterium]
MICRLSKFTPEQEIIPLEQGTGRVLAQDAYSLNELPNAAVSRLDGIAYRFADYQRCGGDCSQWQEGRDYVFSNTGVAIPPDYDCVTLIEDCQFDAAGALRITAPPQGTGQNISPAGSRMQTGDILLRRGQVLEPAHLGLLAEGGFARIAVRKKPVVAFIPTGDELIPRHALLPKGKTVESNSLVIGEWIRRWGGEPYIFPIVPDDLDLLSQALRRALSCCDIVVLNAGSSKGRKDFATDAMNSVGEVYVYETGCGPGKHASFALSPDGKPILGLAGPPGGAALTAGWYLAPLICQYLGKPLAKPGTIRAILLDEAKAHVPFEFYLPVTAYRRADGVYVAQPHGHGNKNRPAFIANAILPIPGGRRFAPGEEVELELQTSREYLPPYQE